MQHALDYTGSNLQTLSKVVKHNPIQT